MTYWIRNVSKSEWYCSPGHTERAMSKRLVGAADGSVAIGYVLSSYEPGHCMEPHTHAIRDQVYHVLSGEGVLTIDGGERRVVAGDVAFLPAGVAHGMANDGTGPLVFVIVSSPADEPAISDQSEERAR